MENLSKFFARLHDVDFKYVVMRNWENLPYAVETGAHSDLDLLVYDLDHFIELNPFLEREHPHPRVRYKMKFDNLEYIFLDARYVGDGYYPDQFEDNMLKTKEWNSSGFFTPNPMHHRIGLAYHCVHHKNVNTYSKFMGKLPILEMLEALKKNAEFAWVEPEDPTVGRFNPYNRGSTSVVSGNGKWVEKKQYRYLAYKLIDNEERILKTVKGKHFPNLISRDGDSIRIEHCGEPLTIKNLPDNWRTQLDEILDGLKESKVVHRDVRMDNIMVKKGVIMMMDFGWARMENEPDGKHPDFLGYPNKCPLRFDDCYSMNRIIKQIELELEDLCQTAS